MDLAIGGISALALVVGLVQAAKEQFGISGRGAFILALVLGLVISLAYQVGVMFPSFAPWIQQVVIGLVIGMAATGWYDLGSKWTRKP